MIYADIIIACWVIFLVYWQVSAVRVKKDAITQGSLWSAAAGRLLLALAIVLVLRIPLVRRIFQAGHAKFAFAGAATHIISVVLCAAGIAFAIWARAHLGANWSWRPSVKEGHELVTSGPYRIVRHPIYSGALLALLGTALFAGIAGMVLFLVVCIVLIHRIRVEERLMMRVFPDRYPEYKKHTKALIPFII